MSTINTWTDDLVGQRVTYRGEENVLICEASSGEFGWAWSAKRPDGVAAIPLSRCEIIPGRVEAFLCPLVETMDRICRQVQMMKADLDNAMYESIQGDSYLEYVKHAAEDTSRRAKTLARQANELERLAESSKAPVETTTPRYEYAIQVLNEGEWEYAIGYNDSVMHVLITSPHPHPSAFTTTLKQAEEVAKELETAGKAETCRIVRRTVGEPEVVE